MAWLAVVVAGCAEIFGVINIKRMTEKKWDAATLFNHWFWSQLILVILCDENYSYGHRLWSMDWNWHSRRYLIRHVFVRRTKRLEKNFLYCADYCFGCGVEGYFVK